MNKEEIDLLLEIDKIYSDLIEEPTGKWTGSRMLKPSGYSYTGNAKKLEEKVYKLYNTFNPDYLDENTLHALSHTCGKEVSYVEHHYDRSIKRNAAKIRHTEFINSIHKANEQIHLDLFSLFAKIDDVKKMND